jgi:alpha-L-rhamnosidase
MSTNDGTGLRVRGAVRPRGTTAPEITAILVERADRPLGIDVSPRISWTIRSDLIDITVISAAVTVSHNGSPVWTSLPLLADFGLFEVECPRDTLSPDTRYDIDVTIETSIGQARGVSCFRTGFFDERDWQASQWISAPAELAGAAPMLRAEFDAPAQTDSARLYLAAGGFARVLINGAPVSADVLGPGITAYNHRVQYVVWEVAPLLRDGANVLTVELGKGFYGMTERNIWEWEAAPWKAAPCVRLTIEADGPSGSRRLLASSEDFTVIAGPTRYDDLYGGETFDGRLDVPTASGVEFDDSTWRRATAVSGPLGRLLHQRQPGIRVVNSFSGTVTSHASGRLVVDFGRIIAGWVRLEVSGPAGHTIEMRYGEKLTADGRPNDDDPLHYYNGRFQLDRLTLSGGEQQWESRFGWKGFRYVEITNWPGDAPHDEQITAREAHSDVAVSGRFTTSDPVMQAVHDLTVRTILNNLHSIPTDTPKYEKNGWTADGMIGTEMMLLNLDAHEFLAKWVDDIADSRDGLGVPSVIAPRGGWTYDWTPAPPWHAAYVMIPWWLYRYGGDTRVLRDHFDGILAYLAVELQRSDQGIAATTLGDWVSPQTSPAGGNPPEDLRVCATVYLHLMLETAAAMARVLDRETDAAALTEQAAFVRTAFLARFVDVEATLVRGVGDDGYRQSHNVLALAHGLLPVELRQSVADRLARDVRERAVHLNTGVLSTKYLLPVLTEFGHADLALALAQQTTFPSWGHWVERGATTLWEHWHEDARSHGHFFLGTVDDWFYNSVLGLRVDDMRAGRITVRPAVIGAVDSASGVVHTPYGAVSIDWRVVDGTCEVTLQVPVGLRAHVVLPGVLAHDIGNGRHEYRFPVESGARDMLGPKGMGA